MIVVIAISVIMAVLLSVCIALVCYINHDRDDLYKPDKRHDEALKIQEEIKQVDKQIENIDAKIAEVKNESTNINDVANRFRNISRY